MLINQECSIACLVIHFAYSVSNSYYIDLFKVIVIQDYIFIITLIEAISPAVLAGLMRIEIQINL